MLNVLSPRVIYGTAWKGERTTHLVVNAFLQGFRAVDTACQPKHYREDLVGEALDTLQKKYDIKRDEIHIQTKFTPVGGQDLNKPIPYNVSDAVKDQIAASLRVSLRNLRTSYIDSYLLHSPLRTMKGTLEAWRALMAAQDAGTVRKIGVSNVYDTRVLAALGELRKVQVVQNRWYEGNMWDPDVWKYCKDHGIEYQSFWTLSGSTSLLTHPAVVTIAGRLDVTPAQVIYKLAQLHSIVPLTGTTNELHMQQDLAAERIAFMEDVDGEVRNITKFIWGR
ncbi:NADP-dependent oxidoreductase domain-containing protein [Boletus edulis]|uniref:NADP-dependent oxidoreductase domain-containing protein n=1 Tax=Boletus edulis BED1 TaxID=1328754 RepID=A0AAD4GHB5_BOLED|nr:NADP-dependent oxidoreductase domain-containing protein [Boletus edulis]KAF8444842.1 NADP-dependent oxidoreductase domain-containing protein [Boletus edulis BED1]